MPKLQRLKLMFNADGSEQNGSAPVGTEHLLALEELSEEIGCYCFTESEEIFTEFALMNAMNMHPSHPHVGIVGLQIGIFWQIIFLQLGIKQLVRV